MPPSTRSEAVQIYLGPKAPKRGKLVKNDQPSITIGIAYCGFGFLLFKRFLNPSCLSFDDLEVVSLKRIVEWFPPGGHKDLFISWGVSLLHDKVQIMHRFEVSADVSDKA